MAIDTEDFKILLKKNEAAKNDNEALKIALSAGNNVAIDALMEIKEVKKNSDDILKKELFKIIKPDVPDRMPNYKILKHISMEMLSANDHEFLRAAILSKNSDVVVNNLLDSPKIQDSLKIDALATEKLLITALSIKNEALAINLLKIPEVANVAVNGNDITLIRAKYPDFSKAVGGIIQKQALEKKEAENLKALERPKTMTLHFSGIAAKENAAEQENKKTLTQEVKPKSNIIKRGS